MLIEILRKKVQGNNIRPCVGFAWQSFSSGVLFGGFSQKPPEASPLFDGPSAASPKTDPLLAEAEFISNSGSASGIMYLERVKNHVCNCGWRGEQECVRVAALQTLGSVRKKVLQVSEHRLIPLQSVVQTLVRQGVPCSPWRADIHLQPKEVHGVEEVSIWSRYLTLEQGKTVRSKERQRQPVRNWLQSLFPIPLHHWRGEGEEFGNEVEPRKKWGVGEGVLRLFLILIILVHCQLAINENNFPEAHLFCPWR